MSSLGIACKILNKFGANHVNKTLLFRNNSFLFHSTSIIDLKANRRVLSTCTMSLSNKLQNKPSQEIEDTNSMKFLKANSLNNSSNKQSDEQKKDPLKKPTLEQLTKTENQLKQCLPTFLEKTHPYNMYTPDVVFENYFKEPGKVTVGVLQYAIQLTVLRWKIHYKFSHAKLVILKTTNDELDGTIKVRWRIKGVRGIKSMIQPWSIKIWKPKHSINTQVEWIDGFSILYVRGDGLIYKHRLQRVITQNDEQYDLVNDKNKKVVQNLDVGPTICSNK